MIFKAFAFLALLALALIACGTEQAPLTATPLPDIGATVEAAVAGALPTETPTSPPDIDATVVAMVAATQSAVPTATPTPPPDIDATVEARMAATVAAMPMPTLSAAPTATPAPAHTPTPTASPVPTATPRPTPVPTRTPRPTPTRRPTSTPRPISTPVPTVAPVNRLSEMVKQVRPSVVRIETSSAGGTGVIFETSGQTAYVITNQHVVEGAAEVNITVNDSTVYPGTVLGTDPVRDLAVVRICCGSFTKLSFGDASALEPGDEVVAIGYALGLSGQASITRGIVSAIRYDSELLSDVIQTDAAINPGNSGGPILSMSGEILGINTYRIDEAESGRMAEGLGFAVSERTVQARIPTLKVAQAGPTPTPTHRPTPIPVAGGGYGYGPEDGELWHDPSGGFIKTEYARVSLSDFIVSATFTNPYSAASNPWDYGFIIRASGTDAARRFIQIVVNGRGLWTVDWRQGTGGEKREIADGALKQFNTGRDGQNTIWLAVFDGRGLLFVNGDFISELDLSEVTGPGDVAIGTGFFTGGEVAGAVTHYMDFIVGGLDKEHGPAKGKLEDQANSLGQYGTGLWTRDLVAEATFTATSGTDWYYGFAIRNPEFNRLDFIGINANKYWLHQTRDVGDDEYTEVEGRRFSPALRRENHLLLFAIEDWGMLFVNGHLVSPVDLSHNLDYGGVAVVGGYFLNRTGDISFSNFNVWTPQP